VGFFLVPSTKTAIISPVPERGATSARRAAADSGRSVNHRSGDPVHASYRPRVSQRWTAPITVRHTTEKGRSVRHPLSGLFFGFMLATGCGSDTNPVAPSPVQPSCTAPAPLLGVPNPAAPGYIVLFYDNVDAVAETQRLAAKHAFAPTYVYQSAIKGFAAQLRPEVVAALRCEPSVASIEYNSVVTTTSSAQLLRSHAA
jgi:hypothetical protein